MKVTAFYYDGRVEEYNTETHYSSSELFGSKNVGVVNFNLDLEDVDGGLWIKFCYYEGGDSFILPVTGKSGYGAQLISKLYYPLLTKEELERVAYIECDGTRILWRPEPGEPLVNDTKFASCERLHLGTHDELPVTTRVAELYAVLSGKDGGAARMTRFFNETDEDWHARIADAMGFDPASLAKLLEYHDTELQ